MSANPYMYEGQTFDRCSNCGHQHSFECSTPTLCWACKLKPEYARSGLNHSNVSRRVEMLCVSCGLHKVVHQSPYDKCVHCTLTDRSKDDSKEGIGDS